VTKNPTEPRTWISTQSSETKKRQTRLLLLPETNVKILCALILSGRLVALINGRAVAINKYYVMARERGAITLMTHIDLLQRQVEPPCLFNRPANSPAINHVVIVAQREIAADMVTADEGWFSLFGGLDVVLTRYEFCHTASEYKVI
jgi:hypothetical protein